MSQTFEPPVHGKVMKEWRTQYSDPIDVVAGESVVTGQTDPEWPEWQWCTDPRGKSGWVPIAYFEKSGDQKGTMICDYVARELTVTPGEDLLLLCLESGWCWAQNGSGMKGWVPASHVMIREIL